MVAQLSPRVLAQLHPQAERPEKEEIVYVVGLQAAPDPKNHQKQKIGFGRLLGRAIVDCMS